MGQFRKITEAPVREEFDYLQGDTNYELEIDEVKALEPTKKAPYQRVAAQFIVQTAQGGDAATKGDTRSWIFRLRYPMNWGELRSFAAAALGISAVDVTEETMDEIVDGGRAKGRRISAKVVNGRNEDSGAKFTAVTFKAAK